MVTEETFENLKSLQDILVEKYALQKKVAEAPKQLDIWEAALAKQKKDFISINTNYEEVKAKIGKLEVDLEEATKSRESGEKGMDNITTHREYEALEKQINEAKSREDDLRKEKQHEEKNLAELQETLKLHEDDIKSMEEELASTRANLDKEINEYNAKLAELKTEEDKIAPKLDQEILFKFERIIQRNAEGIVSVRNGVCTGCHMILPAQFANIVRTGENINFCPYCSRILYYEEVPEDEAESFADFGAAGSLADLDDNSDLEMESEEAEDEDTTTSYEDDSFGSDYDENSINDERDDVDDEQDDEEESEEEDEE